MRQRGRACPRLVSRTPVRSLFAPLLDLDPLLDGNEEGCVELAPFAVADGLLVLANHRAALWVVIHEIVQVLFQLWVVVEVLSLLGEFILD